MVPDPEFLPGWAKKRGLVGSYLELCKSKVNPLPPAHTHTHYNNISNPGEKEVKAWISVKRSAWLQFISQPILLFVWCVCALKLHFLFSFFFVQEVKNAILEDIVRLGKEGGLKSFEQVS